MAYRVAEGLTVWSRGQATQCLRSGIADVGGKWKEEGMDPGARLIPEDFALQSGRIGVATRLAAKRVPEAVICKEGRKVVIGRFHGVGSGKHGRSSMGIRGARGRGCGVER